MGQRRVTGKFTAQSSERTGRRAGAVGVPGRALTEAVLTGTQRCRITPLPKILSVYRINPRMHRSARGESKMSCEKPVDTWQVPLSLRALLRCAPTGGAEHLAATQGAQPDPRQPSGTCDPRAQPGDDLCEWSLEAHAA